MNIQETSVAEITPYSKNAKKHPKDQIKKIAASIQRFGFRQPIVADKNGVIIIGHGRFEAAKELGMTSVPVTIADDLTDGEISALRLADNKLNESEWDMELVNMELGELDAELKELTGFEAMEVLEAQEDDFDTTPPEEPKSKLGDLYQLGEHRLLCGSATVITDVERLMDGEYADLIVTDPPYNVAYTGKTKDALKIENDEMDNEGFHQFLLDAFVSMFMFTKDGAGFYVFHADSEGYNFRGSLVEAGFLIKQCCIWVKQTLVMGRQDYQWQHEPVLYGWKPGEAHHWYSDRKQTTLWNFNRPSRSPEHPTTKPIDLIAYPIENSSQKGEIVMDLFGGSGSTLIACEQLKRRCRMTELDPRYVDVIIARWEKLTGGKAVPL